MEYEIAFEEDPSQDVIAVRADTNLTKIAETMGKAYQDLYRHIGSHAIAPVGPPTAVYSDVDGAGDVSVEICVPVPEAIEPEDEIIADELPAATVITTLHRGRYEDLPEAYYALRRYAEEHGLRLAGPMREQYLNGPPETPPERYETRIQWPVRKAA